MKKILTLMISLILSQLLLADEKEVKWTDIDSTCFRLKADVKTPSQATIKVRTGYDSQLFFVQNDTVLPAKVFEYGREQYIDYEVLSVTGSSDNTKKSVPYLYDGNYKTALAFDPYSNENPSITVKAGRLLKSGSFRFKLHFKGRVRAQYRISKDNQTFIEVSQPNAHDWQYLTVVFKNFGKKDPKKYPLAIQELNLLTQAPTTYLVNSVGSSTISLYSRFDCKSDHFTKLLSQTRKKVTTTRYRLDSKTKRYDLLLKRHSGYNNDFDNDGISNSRDNCPFAANHNQLDSDKDLVGDVCDYDNETRNFHDKDTDHDGVGDSLDNCVYVFNPRQIDSNADKRGDLCSDDDNDGIIGHLDNCVNIANFDQKDININGIGDACEFDKDADGIFDSVDNCITVKNKDQADADGDLIGDACDNCKIYNPDQRDQNKDGVGDRCEDEDKFIKENDKDGDGIIDHEDNCPKVANKDQTDTDKDGIGDACDNCREIQNSDQIDKDKNMVGDLCEDSDKDGIIGYQDNCIYHSNKDQKDTDNDHIGNVCEDDDGDNLVAADDNCPFIYNPDQWDVDNDGIGDKCDGKDDRLLESNRWIVISIIVVITLVFGVLIFAMIRKLRNQQD